jgi:hypothetical protein
MPKIAKLSPIKKTYGQSFRTFESSLASHELYRAPGTVRSFTPYREANGKYRTGLDKDALYLRGFSEEARKVEYDRIDETLEKLEGFFGAGIDWSPTSKVWNAFSNSPIKVNPVKIGSSSEFFDLESGVGLLNYTWIRVHPHIAPSFEAYKRGEYPDVQYYLADDEVETKQTYNRKREINQAIVAFEQMTPTKKKQVARLMGLPIGDSVTEEQVYNDIDTLLKQSEFSEGEYKGLSTIRVFKEISSLDDARLKVKDLVEQAIRNSIYRVGLHGKIQEGANVVSPSKEELVTHLLDDSNQMELLALQKRLEVKKFANVV